MTLEFHACLLQHLDLINGPRGGRDVGGPCGGGERSKGQSHKSRVINHFVISHGIMTTDRYVDEMEENGFA